MIICIKCGLNILKAYKNKDSQMITTEALYLVVLPFVYQGLLTISSIIADPFGTDMLDFPIQVFSEHVHKSCLSMEITSQFCPALELTKASGKNRREQNGPSLLAREALVDSAVYSDWERFPEYPSNTDIHENCGENATMSDKTRSVN